MKVGDNVWIERKDGYTTIGTFVEEDENYIVLQGTVGDNIGKTILVPRDNIAQITVH